MINLAQDNRLTNDQAQIVDAAYATALALAQQLFKLAREAYSTIVPLPLVNERGYRVVHKCNLVVGDIAEIYYKAALALVSGLDLIVAERLAAEQDFTLGGKMHVTPKMQAIGFSTYRDTYIQ